MITCLTKLILFIISTWEVCRAWLAGGCWRVCFISVGGRLLFTAVVKWKQIYVCWQSQQWLQTMGSLHVCIPTGDRNACTVSSSFLLVLSHFLMVFLLKRSALALLPVCVRGAWEHALTAPTQLCVCIAHLSPCSSCLPFECCKVLGRVLTALFAEPYLKNKLSESSRSV